LNQKSLILFTNSAVISDHNSSKDLDNIFLITHLDKTSFINQSSSGTISLNNNLQYEVSMIFQLTLTFIIDLIQTIQAS
jgi:hypothetical protein